MLTLNPNPKWHVTSANIQHLNPWKWTKNEQVEPILPTEIKRILQAAFGG